MGRKPDVARRRDLLDGTVRCLLEAGLAGASLPVIAASLETSPRMLLYHFSSKDQLIAEALEVARAQQRALFAGWLGTNDGGDYGDVLRRAWTGIEAEEARPYLRLFQELAAVARQPASQYAAFAERTVLDWLPTVEAGLAAAGVAPEVGGLATFVVDGLRGLILDLLATGDRERVRAGLEQLARAVTRAGAAG